MRAVLAALLLAGALDVHAQSVHLSRLDADPPAATVLSGAADARFVEVAGDRPVISERTSGNRWWRVTALDEIPARDDPVLVLQFPYLSRIEAWRPGDTAPVRRSLMGEDADYSRAARAFFLPLPGGLRQGEHVDIRLQSQVPVSMLVTVEPAAYSHRMDLAYVGWRTAIMVTMLVLALLALGFRLGVGERGYVYLAIALLGQMAYLATIAGDLRMFPMLADMVGNDPTPGRVFGFGAVIASNLFVADFLDLRAHHPRLLRALRTCNALLVVLIVLTLFSTSLGLAVVGNLLVLFCAGVVFWAGVAGLVRGRRPAQYLLFSWLPLLLLVAIRIIELLGLWSGPYWLSYAYPATFALAGLIVSIGLSAKMAELRRDRDQAHEVASRDALTGTHSRLSIRNVLGGSVEDAHRSGSPLSVVFFDIDNFKGINDTYGHLAGDECLKVVARRVAWQLHATGGMIGRYGGDEMLVVLPGADLATAQRIAEAMRAAVAGSPIAAGNVLLEATLSLGVAQLGTEEVVESLLDRADVALYASKAGGRNRISPAVGAPETALS